MRRKISSKFHGGVAVAVLAGAVAVAALATGPGAVKAGIIYSDQFNRGSEVSPVPLNGTTPTTDPSLAPWSVVPTSSPLTTNGTEAVFGGTTPNPAPYAAYLPVTLTGTGHLGTYTLSVTLIPTANSTDMDWLAMGFGNTAGGGEINSTGTEAWALYRENGQVQSFYGGATGNGVTSSTSATPGTADTFTITINSSTGAASIVDTLGLVSRAFTLTSTEMGNVNAVIIGKFNTATGDAQNLTLTYTTPVPESATLGLLGVGGLGLLLVGPRRKQKTNP